ncbi:MAG: pitrilysin family protein [Candidatus Roizmanbacteria bacterium]
MKYDIQTLPNGLKVLLIDTEAFPTVTSMLLVGAGSRYENDTNNGIAHFFEHMAFKGSKKYPHYSIIASTIDEMGGIFNAFTSKDHTGYFIKTTSDQYPKVADILSDMILNPLIPEDELEKEKGVIIEEINMYEDTPSDIVGQMFETLLYEGNPLGFRIIGTKELIRNSNKQIFLDYINKLYHPSNALFVVAGGLNNSKNANTSNHYLEVAKEKFGMWKDQPVDTFTPVVETQSKPQIIIQKKPSEQAHFVLGFRTFSQNDSRRRALSVLSTVLGGGMSSRLFDEVREKRGLCYYISTGRQHYHDVGYLATQAGVPTDVEKVKEAMRVTYQEHMKIVNGDIKEEEIVRAKAMIKGRMMLSLEDSYRVASFMGTKLLLEGKIEMPEDIIGEVEKVTKDDIVQLAREFFIPEKLNIALIGPFETDVIKTEEIIS